MKRLLTPVALAIGLFAGTSSAVAAPPTHNDPSPTTLDCPGFQVEARATGSSKVIESLHPSPDSKFFKVFTNIGAASTMTLTALTPTPKVVRYSLNGTIRVALDLNAGDIVFTGTGRNLITVPKVYGTPGIFLSVGLVTWTLGGPVYPNAGLTGPGTVTDVCQLLAP